jgi:urease accessory protein
MQRLSLRTGASLAAALSLAATQSALAHPGHGGHGGSALTIGALHPLLGADHLLAALASGLLAVRIGSRRALWAVPATFIALMLLGGALAASGLPLPQAEWGIMISVIVLGLMVAALPKVSLPVAALLVGLFALCHGHAHVAELGATALLPYMIGFALTTAALHAASIGTGLLAIQINRAGAVRFAGAAIAAAFVLTLITI